MKSQTQSSESVWLFFIFDKGNISAKPIQNSTNHAMIETHGDILHLATVHPVSWRLFSFADFFVPKVLVRKAASNPCQEISISE
jgi:hypothetical protein